MIFEGLIVTICSEFVYCYHLFPSIITTERQPLCLSSVAVMSQPVMEARQSAKRRTATSREHRSSNENTSSNIQTHQPSVLSVLPEETEG